MKGVAPVKNGAAVSYNRIAQPAVSIVVPCRNEKGHIESMLRSILAQEPPPGGFEIVVTDGMSDDGTRTILERLAAQDTRLRIVDNPGRIVSTGLNAAIQEARGSAIVRMDAHTEYAADYVKRCVEILNSTGADNVGGPARTKSTGKMQAAIAAAFHSRFSTGRGGFHDPNYEGVVDTVTYGCWPREVFDRLGLFDEELVRNQDDEFNLRLTRSGGKIWQSPLIKSWYRPRTSMASLFTQYMQYGYWKVRVIKKHKLLPSARHIIPLCFLLSLVLMPATFVLWPSLFPLWLGAVAAYFACSSVASLITAARYGWRLLPLLPCVFACYHFGYAYGFCRGIWDFVVIRRRARGSFTALTRKSALG